MSEELNPQQEPSRFDRRYRLVVVNDESYEEIGSYRLTELNIYIGIAAAFVATVLFCLLLFVFTPLKNIIPGYADVNALSNRKEIVKVFKRVDSLEDVLGAQAIYIQSVGKAMRGEKDVQDLQVPSEVTDFSKSHPVNAAETPAKNTPIIEGTQKAESGKLDAANFIAPVSKGMITDVFNAQPGHFGIDIAAPKDSPIQAVADGIVICATWTVDTGFIIGVQHANNTITFYKHNSVLYKKVGTEVKAGEAIAVIGNTGDLSTGPHLHFELWHDGKPVNPSDYIQL
jgi:murein DD-endopeptidase MepM/ murein hydrolase activator NlpD